MAFSLTLWTAQVSSEETEVVQGKDLHAQTHHGEAGTESPATASNTLYLSFYHLKRLQASHTFRLISA